MESSGSVESALGGLSFADGELILICVVMLVLFGEDKGWPFARGFGRGIKGFLRAFRRGGREAGESFGAGLGKPVADALTHSNQTREFQDPPALRLRKFMKQLKDHFVLWTAQGFGVGRIPLAPGTFGSLVGLVWFAVLLCPRSFGWYVGGTIAGMLLSVWFCGRAERMLNQTDPGSVVLDEISAMPLCFLVWAGVHFVRHGTMPAPEHFFRHDTWPFTLAVFA